MSTIVVPPSCSERMRSQNARRASGSNPVVGSSRKSSSGRPMIPRATSRRRRWPPESLSPAGVALLGQADGLDHLPDVARDAGSTRRSGATASATRQVGQVAGGLQHDAEPRAPVPVAVVRVVAQHLDVPAVALAVALEDLHGRRLAGAVGAEQGDALADLDVEVEAVDGRQVAVVLGEAADADRAGHAPTLAPRTWSRTAGWSGRRSRAARRSRGRRTGCRGPRRACAPAA